MYLFGTSEREEGIVTGYLLLESDGLSLVVLLSVSLGSSSSLMSSSSEPAQFNFR
jgi:hypothetical protein